MEVTATVLIVTVAVPVVLMVQLLGKALDQMKNKMFQTILLKVEVKMETMLHLIQDGFSSIMVIITENPVGAVVPAVAQMVLVVPLQGT